MKNYIIGMEGIFAKFLRPYQRKVVQTVSRRFSGRALVVLDMGLGKTVIALSLAEEALRKRPGRPVVVVCPAPLKYNWLAEMRKFGVDAPVHVCRGRRPPRGIGAAVYICNYEILMSWRDELRSGRPSLLICDESQYLKERTAKRTKAAIALSRACEECILLTGTPIENRPVELWTQVGMVDPRLFPNWLRFAKRYNSARHTPFGWKMGRASNTDELNSILLGRCMIRMRKEEVLKELPPLTRQVIPVAIDNRREYAKANADILGWLGENNPNGLDVERLRRLRMEAQIRVDKLKLISARGKVAQISEWVNAEAENQKIVLFCFHRDILRRLSETVRNAVVISQETPAEERQRAVDRFQKDGSCRVFLTTIRIGGTGFTLTASSLTVFAQLDWTPSRHWQAEARVHRIGQTASRVNAVYFIAKDTIEERIMRIIEQKNGDITKVIEGEERNVLTSLIRGMMRDGGGE